jgi:peptidoglycan LD-endopeptidase CwlK
MSYQMNKKDVLLRQHLLKASGFDPHGLDGVWGGRTHAADESFLAASVAMRDEIGAFDVRTEGNIRSLHIKAQRLAREFMFRAAGFAYLVKIISGTRTYAEQDDLYAKGRWVGPPGPRETWARGGQSNHYFGIAWDVALFEDGRYMNGDAAHDAQAYRDLAGQALVPGLEWGGAWKKSGSPHYQVASDDKKISEVRERFEAGEPYV